MASKDACRVDPLLGHSHNSSSGLYYACLRPFDTVEITDRNELWDSTEINVTTIQPFPSE